MFFKILWSCLGFWGLWMSCYHFLKWWSSQNLKREKAVFLPLRRDTQNLELLLREILMAEEGDFSIYLLNMGVGIELSHTVFLLQHDFPQLHWIEDEKESDRLWKNLCLKNDVKYSIIVSIKNH